MKEAIQKAIEGGWKSYHRVGDFQPSVSASKTLADVFEVKWSNSADQPMLVRFNDLVMDPLFWQSLGKALEWKETNLGVSSGNQAYTIHEWMMYWHLFIDHLVEGKNAESFFNQFLTKNE